MFEKFSNLTRNVKSPKNAETEISAKFKKYKNSNHHTLLKKYANKIVFLVLKYFLEKHFLMKASFKL